MRAGRCEVCITSALSHFKSRDKCRGAGLWPGLHLLGQAGGLPHDRRPCRRRSLARTLTLRNLRLRRRCRRSALSTTMSASLPAVSVPFVVLERREGRVARVRPQGLVRGSLPARKERLAVGHLPRDAGIEAAERIDLLDRHVGAVDDHRAGVEQRPPGIAPALGRRSPSRATTNGPSDVAWLACIEAMTPSCAKRGMSAGSMCWACSIRQRSRCP